MAVDVTDGRQDRRCRDSRRGEHERTADDNEGNRKTPPHTPGYRADDATPDVSRDADREGRANSGKGILVTAAAGCHA